MKTSTHFKKLREIVKEKGVFEGLKYDFEVTKERHPNFVDCFDDLLHNHNSIFSPEPQIYVLGRGWCSAGFAFERGLCSEEVYHSALKSKGYA